MATTTYGSPYAQSADLVSAWPATSLSVADRIDDVSFKGNGLNNQTASYTGVLLDAGKTVMMNVATANTFTIPASGAVAYELGTVLRVSNKGAGTTTVQPNVGVVLNGGNITLTQYQSCEVQLVAADIWVATVKPGTPKILQVVSATYSTSVTTTSATYADTGLTASITPSSATSKILVQVSHSSKVERSGTNNVYSGIKILRDSTGILVGPGYEYGFLAGSSDLVLRSRINMIYMDSPASTSALTYKTQSSVYSGAGSLTLQEAGQTSTIILMEVAG